jgi:hypothetical protein
MDKTIKPNFFIVGASKCGTTALSEYLRSHPYVFIVKEKETHYFCTDFDKRYPRPQTLSEYTAQFRGANGKKAIGEASPWYIYSKCALKNAYQFSPSARFIAMVRNPLEMVPSLHRQLLNNQDEDQQDLAAAWKLQSKRKLGNNLPTFCREARLLQYREACELGRQIENMFNIIPSHQRMVVVFDDLKQNTQDVYRSVLAFLDLKDDGMKDFPIVNSSFKWRFNRISKFILTPPPYIQSMGSRFLKLIGRERIGLFRYLYFLNDKFNRKKNRRKELDPIFKKELIETFTDDIFLLGKLLNRDLTGWLN